MSLSNDAVHDPTNFVGYKAQMIQNRRWRKGPDVWMLDIHTRTSQPGTPVKEGFWQMLNKTYLHLSKAK